MEIKSTPKSFTYEVDAVWVAEKHGRMEAAGKPAVDVATPPEFKGHPGIWSPEDLFVESVNVCTMVTFVGMAQRRNVRFESYRCRATGLLEHMDGKFRFTQITLHPLVSVASVADVEPVRQVLHDAEDSCLISNSIHARVSMEERIEVLGTVQS